MATKSKKLDPIEKKRRADERARVRDLRRAEKKARHVAEVADRRAKRRADSKWGHFSRAMRPWTPEERASYRKWAGRDVGPGEFSSASAMGLELVVGHRTHRNDLPNGVEVKSIQGKGTQLIPLRAGIDAVKKFIGFAQKSGRWIERRYTQIEAARDVYADHGQSARDELERVELYINEGFKSTWRRDLPEDLVLLGDAMLRPSVGLSEYDMGIMLTTREGSIFVRPEDYDAAFELCAVSKANPKYVVRADYLRALPDYVPGQPSNIDAA